MLKRVFHLLLCVLLAGPVGVPGWAIVHSETRVWGSPDFSFKFASDLASQVAEPQQENPSSHYDFAPGVRKYLYAHADPVNGIDPSGHDFTILGLQVNTSLRAVLATAVIIAVNVAIISQVSVNYQQYFGFNNVQIDAEVHRTDGVIAALQRIIDSDGTRTFQEEGMVQGGAMWVQMQNDIPGQALRNLFENPRNLRAIPSAVEESFGRFFGGRSAYGGFAFDAIPPANAQKDFEREIMAEAIQHRHEAYRNWLLRYR